MITKRKLSYNTAQDMYSITIPKEMVKKIWKFLLR